MIKMEIVEDSINKLNVHLNTQISLYTSGAKRTNKEFEEIHKTFSLLDSAVGIYGNLVGISHIGKEPI